MKMNLFEILKKQNKGLGVVSFFTTPSHSQQGFLIPELKKNLTEKYFELDFSEIDSLDNLSAPKNILKKIQQKASKIYDSKQSFYLVNGSTSGVLASVLACVKHNEKILVARNSHKSLYSALVLSGAKPVWVMSEVDTDWDILKPLTLSQIEHSIRRNPDAKALFITNPTYEGLVCDMKPIVELCRESRVKLIVDEAHAALWNFTNELPSTAIRSGADISIQSLHKTAGAINPAAIMHIGKSSEISEGRIQQSLNLVNTTSPSFPLIATIEACIDFLASEEGKEEIAALFRNIAEFKSNLQECDNLEIFEEKNDKTKILVKIKGLSGAELSGILYNQYKIEDELANAKSVLFLTGIGTTKNKLGKLEQALKSISKTDYTKEIKLVQSEIDPSAQNVVSEEIVDELDKIFMPPENPKPKNLSKLPVPKVIYSPKKAFESPFEEVLVADSVGKVSFESIIPYPPAIPVLLGGELIKEEHLPYFSPDKKTIKVISLRKS